MKYEMIFGDYKFANCTCEIAMQSDHGEVIEMTLTTPVVVHEGWRMIAMRRIIKEPKRWTWEDKKAGRLPEVGAKAVQCHEYCTVDILSVHHGYVVVCNSDIDDSRPVSFAIEKFIELFNSIETPEEKAKREEDEFVEELASGVARYDSFINGARAAYRKLKGGE